MIKMTRRDTLKFFSLAGFTAAFPSLTQARLLPQYSQTTAEPLCDAEVAGVGCTHPQADFDLTIQRIVAKQPSDDYALVTLRNRSSARSTLRYIYPGVVEQEGLFFDLNSLLSEGEVTLEAQQTVYRRLLPMQQLADRLNPPNEIAQSGQVNVINGLSSLKENSGTESLRSVFA